MGDNRPPELRGIDLDSPGAVDEVARRAADATLAVGREVTELVQKRMAPWAAVLAELGDDAGPIWTTLADHLRAFADGIDPSA